MNKVNRYTRAGRDGKHIQCPYCENQAVVYHFAWSALTCINCESSVNKPDWGVLYVS